jgi:hypothetical protein
MNFNIDNPINNIGKITVKNNSDNTQTFKKVNTIDFDTNSGFAVTSTNSGQVQVGLNSHWYTITSENDQTSITPDGQENIIFEGQNGINISTVNGNKNNKKVIFTTDGTLSLSADSTTGTTTDYQVATDTENGLMSAEDKDKLDNLTNTYISVRASTTDVLPFSVPATNQSGTLTLDDIELDNNDKILIKNSNDFMESEHGIYTYKYNSDNTYNLERDIQNDTIKGLFIYVQEGTANGGKIFISSRAGLEDYSFKINFIELVTSNPQDTTTGDTSGDTTTGDTTTGDATNTGSKTFLYQGSSESTRTFSSHIFSSSTKFIRLIAQAGGGRGSSGTNTYGGGGGGSGQKVVLKLIPPVDKMWFMLGRGGGYDDMHTDGDMTRVWWRIPNNIVNFDPSTSEESDIKCEGGKSGDRSNGGIGLEGGGGGGISSTEEGLGARLSDLYPAQFDMAPNFETYVFNGGREGLNATNGDGGNGGRLGGLGGIGSSNSFGGGGGGGSGGGNGGYSNFPNGKDGELGCGGGGGLGGSGETGSEGKGGHGYVLITEYY